MEGEHFLEMHKMMQDVQLPRGHNGSGRQISRRAIHPCPCHCSRFQQDASTPLIIMHANYFLKHCPLALTPQRSRNNEPSELLLRAPAAELLGLKTVLGSRSRVF